MCIYTYTYVPVFRVCTIIILNCWSGQYDTCNCCLFYRHVFTHVHAKQVGSGRPGEGSGRLAISSKDGAKGPLAVTQVGCDTCTCSV